MNVGGQRITTYRSTLTAVPNSKLALMFAKHTRNKTREKSKEYIRYFLDYNPAQFTYLLDQLRAIKRMTNFNTYELNIQAPSVDVPFNFSQMTFELGLNRKWDQTEKNKFSLDPLFSADRFLSPITGTHINLKLNSLVGWKPCHRSNYKNPFDATILKKTCTGKRLLVACRSLRNKNVLTVAGIGKRKNIFDICPSNSYCTTNKENGIGFYYVADSVWGFEGRPKVNKDLKV